MKAAETILESLIFRSRWLLAPFFVGLIVAIAVLLAKFLKDLYLLVAGVASSTESEFIIAVLTLVDKALIAVLLLIITFSGYESFVSKIGTGDHEDRPPWMGKVGFTDLKLKLIGAIVAISAVELLKAFVNVGAMTNAELAWRVGIHLTFVVSGVLFALTDRIAAGRGN